MPWSFGPGGPNTGKLDCSDLQNVDTFHYKRSKNITLVNVATDLLREVLQWAAAREMAIDGSFQTSDFLLKV